MKRGKLSIAEKYTIQGMIADSKTIDEISELIDRSTSCVSKYVDGELDKIVETVAKQQIEAVPETTSEPTPEPVQQVGPKRVTAKDLMGHKVINGKSTAVVMTAAASERGDANRQKGLANREMSGGVYHLDTGKPVLHGEKLKKENTGARTPTETNTIKSMINKNKSAGQIASILNRPVDTVQKWIYELED